MWFFMGIGSSSADIYKTKLAWYHWMVLHVRNSSFKWYGAAILVFNELMESVYTYASVQFKLHLVCDNITLGLDKTTHHIISAERRSLLDIYLPQRVPQWPVWRQPHPADFFTASVLLHRICKKLASCKGAFTVAQYSQTMSPVSCVSLGETLLLVFQHQARLAIGS
jgi:hypothetical protein